MKRFRDSATIYELTAFVFSILIERNNFNKLCEWRHDMPPPLSSPWALKGLARRRADAT